MLADTYTIGETLEAGRRASMIIFLTGIGEFVFCWGLAWMTSCSATEPTEFSIVLGLDVAGETIWCDSTAEFTSSFIGTADAFGVSRPVVNGDTWLLVMIEARTKLAS